MDIQPKYSFSTVRGMAHTREGGGFSMFISDQSTIVPSFNSATIFLLLFLNSPGLCNQIIQWFLHSRYIQRKVR